MLFLYGVFVAMLVGLFWLGVSLSVQLDGWKRGTAFCATVGGLIVLSISSFFDPIVEVCMTMWMRP